MEIHDRSIPTLYVALPYLFRNLHSQGISCGHSVAVGSHLCHVLLSAWRPLEVLCVEVASSCYIFNFICSFSFSVLPVIAFMLVFVFGSVCVCDGVLQVLQMHSWMAVPWNSCNSGGRKGERKREKEKERESGRHMALRASPQIY